MRLIVELSTSASVTRKLEMYNSMRLIVELSTSARNKNVPLGTFFIVLAQAWVGLEPTVAGSNHRKKADGSMLACPWQKKSTSDRNYT